MNQRRENLLKAILLAAISTTVASLLACVIAYGLSTYGDSVDRRVTVEVLLQNAWVFVLFAGTFSLASLMLHRVAAQNQRRHTIAAAVCLLVCVTLFFAISHVIVD